MLFESFISESGVLESDKIPQTLEPLWILGRKYSTLYDMEEILQNMQSKLWLTYRRNFAAIGGTGPTSDYGWGCMLRCGQMVVAQALISRHLGRNWNWKPGCVDPKYRKILKMFHDKKDSLYSIHQIAQMGMMEGKAVGQWFGPNTVAQVLKKLSIYDKWSSLMIHVALDNAVIIDDMVKLCTLNNTSPTNLPSVSKQMSESTDSNGFSIPMDFSFGKSDSKKNSSADETQMKNFSELSHESETNADSASSTQNETSQSDNSWKPLLLFIPLRLGLSELNPVYMNGLKNFFKLRQSIGIIGGKPNHALYFIGVIGDELLYLDPHTTQQVSSCFDDDCERHLADVDGTYHCKSASRMNILNVDPSLALCFYCDSEVDFKDMCNHLRKFLIEPESQPLFELCKERPSHWPPLMPTVTPDPDIVVEEWACDALDDDFVLI